MTKQTRQSVLCTSWYINRTTQALIKQILGLSRSLLRTQTTSNFFKIRKSAVIYIYIHTINLQHQQNQGIKHPGLMRLHGCSSSHTFLGRPTFRLPVVMYSCTANWEMHVSSLYDRCKWESVACVLASHIQDIQGRQRQCGRQKVLNKVRQNKVKEPNSLFRMRHTTASTD
jgi:hypothetical protein